MAGKLQRSTEFDDMYIDNDEGKYVKQSRVSSFTNKEGEMLFRASTPEEKFKYETEKRLNIKKKVDQKIGDKAKADNPYGVKNIELNKDALLDRKKQLAKEAVEKERKEKFDALKKERDKVKALEARPQVPAPPTKSATTNATAPAPAPAQNIIVAQDLTVAQATAAVEVAKKNEDIAAKEAEKKKKEAEEKKKEEEKTALAAKEAQKKAEQEKVVAEKKKAEVEANKKVADEKNALAEKKKADTDAALAIKKEQDTKARLEAAEKALVIAKEKEAAAKKAAQEQAKAADKRGPAPSKPASAPATAPASANGYTVGDYVEFNYIQRNNRSGNDEIFTDKGKITAIDNINYSIENPFREDTYTVYDKDNVIKIPIKAETNKKGLKNFNFGDSSIAKGIVKKIPLYTPKYEKNDTVTYSGGQPYNESNPEFSYEARIFDVIPNDWQISPPSYKIRYVKKTATTPYTEVIVQESELSKIATTSQINDETKEQLDNIYDNPERIKNGMIVTVGVNIGSSGKNVFVIKNNIFILVEKVGDYQYKYYFFKKNDEVINNLTISSVTDVNEENNTVEYVDKDFSTKTVNVSQFIALLTTENKRDYEFTQGNIEKQKSGKKGGRKYRTRKYKRKRSSNIYKRISRATRKYKRSKYKHKTTKRRKRSSK